MRNRKGGRRQERREGKVRNGGRLVDERRCRVHEDRGWKMGGGKGAEREAVKRVVGGEVLAQEQMASQEQMARRLRRSRWPLR